MIPFDKDGKKYYYVAMEKFDDILVELIRSRLTGLFETYKKQTHVLRGLLLQGIIR